MVEVQRRSQLVVEELLEGFRAIVVNGPRQSGKSTLLAQIQSGRGQLVTLDNRSMLDAARNDPDTFLESLGPRAAIDEFQLGGDELLFAVKRKLDSSQARGQLLLAGSTRFLTAANLSETLTGRVGVVDLMPFSVGESTGGSDSFLDAAFSGGLGDLPANKLERRDYLELIVRGGFPELVLGPTSSRFRNQWARSYVETVTAKANITPVADVRRPELLPQLALQIAARSGGELVLADLARELSCDVSTVTSHLNLLETLYLTRRLPAWTTSATNRSKRRSTGFLVDSAIAAYLLGQGVDDLAAVGNPFLGGLVESFVVGEVVKQLGWAEAATTIGHFRDRDDREIDVILERGRQVVGIEIKSTASPRIAHSRHLQYLRNRLGDRFSAGVILHMGQSTITFDEKMMAIPISALWT